MPLRLLQSAALVVGALMILTAPAQAAAPVQVTRPCSPKDPAGSYCGDLGAAATAGLSAPLDVAVDAEGDQFIADGGHFVIRGIHSGVMRTVAGSGLPGLVTPLAPATSGAIAFGDPRGLATTPKGNLVVADAALRAVFLVSRSGVVTTLARANQLRLPVDVAVLPAGQAIVVDQADNSIRLIRPRRRTRRIASGLHRPSQVAADPARAGWVVVTEQGNASGPADVIRVRLADGAREVVAGPGAPGPAGRLRPVRPVGVVGTDDGGLLYVDGPTVVAVSARGSYRALLRDLGQGAGLTSLGGGEYLVADPGLDQVRGFSWPGFPAPEIQGTPPPPPTTTAGTTSPTTPIPTTAATSPGTDPTSPPYPTSPSATTPAMTTPARTTPATTAPTTGNPPPPGTGGAVAHPAVGRPAKKVTAAPKVGTRAACDAGNLGPYVTLLSFRRKRLHVNFTGEARVTIYVVRGSRMRRVFGPRRVRLPATSSGFNTRIRRRAPVRFQMYVLGSGRNGCVAASFRR